MPLHVDGREEGSAQHVCHFGSVMFSILTCWCGGFLLVGEAGALSQGCACGPNPLINSARTGRRWQVGTETGCTPPVFLALSDPEISQISIHSLLLMDRCWSLTVGYWYVWAV